MTIESGATPGVYRSPDLKPTSGVTHEIAVIKSMRFLDKGRLAKNIRAGIQWRNWVTSEAEAACRIRAIFPILGI
ncbi:MAG TPA: hypothetical protein PLD73_18995, partial [Candidatus Hydrogenedentes bacterium]|nr:hypothetical protein [Candidatus Hydrogenedentota bacterium]